jgi:septal ring factor EnvC (AmiA/AmiB activator)
MVSFDKLKLFFERIKSAGFWQRLFGWRSIKTLSYDAYEEFRRIYGQIDDLNKQIDAQKTITTDLEKKNEILGNRLEDSRVSIQKLEEKIRFLEQDQKRLNKENTELSSRIARYEESEETRKSTYEKNVIAVNTAQAWKTSGSN